LEEEVKALPHTTNHVLGMEVNQLMETNARLTREVSHLQASVDKFREEATPLQEDNNHLFDEYQALREYYDSILLYLTVKDETIQGLQDYKQNLEEQVRRLQNVETKIDVVELPGSPISSPPLMFFVRKMLLIYALRLMIVLFLPDLKNTI
jgi:FtsZ-binding cell division protein ZapB